MQVRLTSFQKGYVIRKMNSIKKGQAVDRAIHAIAHEYFTIPCEVRTEYLKDVADWVNGLIPKTA